MQVQAILIADCFTTPVIRILNIYEHVMHYIVAPTMKTQSQMNVLFRGAYWNLAERYTDMIKTLFVGLFYSTIIPSSLFITSFAMLVTYIVDRWECARSFLTLSYLTRRFDRYYVIDIAS